MRNVRALCTVLSLAACAAAAARSAWADDATAKARELESDVVHVVDQVVPAFVFIGGGSGVCISEDGYFLTNNHVAGSSKRWRVKTQDGRAYVADLVGTDRRGDIALLKMKDAESRPHVDLGDSDALETGEYVIAVGNPFLLGRPDCRPTVTFGIVSANHRCEGSYASPKDLQGYLDCIQTDASVNPGNSGGPLFNMKGELVGINGSIAPRFGNRVNTGIGYAIPSNQISRFIPRLKEGKGNCHGVPDGLSLLQGGTSNDAIVGRVKAGTEAEKAGFQKGDVILEVQGMPTPTAARFWGVVWTWPSGETVSCKVRRGEETTQIKVKLTAIDADEKLRDKAQLGVRMEAARDGGVRVIDALEGAPAAKGGVKSDDVIKAIDEKEMKAPADVLKFIGEKKPGDKVKITVLREGKELEIEVSLEGRK